MAPAIVDFGHVKDATVVVGEFRVFNTTSEPVRIVDTATSCGCSKLFLKENSIPARSSITLRLHAEVGKRFGRQLYEAVLYTDSPEASCLRAQMSGIVATSSNQVIVRDIGSYFPNQVIQSQVQIRTGNVLELNLVDDTAKNEYDFVTRISEPKNGETWCTIEGHAPATNGEFQSTAIMRATPPSDWAQQTLVIRGKVIDRWDYPETIYCGFLKRGVILKKTINIHDRFAEVNGERPPQVEDCIVKSSNEGIKATPKILKNGHITIELRIRPDEASAKLDEELQIRLVSSGGVIDEFGIKIYAGVLSEDREVESRAATRRIGRLRHIVKLAFAYAG